MTIRQLLLKSIKKLSRTSKSPALDSEVLLSFILNQPKEYLYLHDDQVLRIRKLRNYHKLIKKRAQGWPIAYLTGQKEFYGLKFYVDKNILIPRPETEGLVELVLTKIKSLPVQIPNSKFQILDIGTGSGCIIISLVKSISKLEALSYKLPTFAKASAGRQVSSFKFYASDVSKKALIVARKNAKQHGVKIKFKQGNLLAPWKNQKFDIILANLPYGWKEWKNNTSTEAVGLKFEPREALFTSKKGLALYEKLFKQIAALSPTPSTLFFEFDPRQTTQIKKLARKILPEYFLEIKKDLTNKNRFLCLSL